MRKFLATLLALVMTLALMVPASWGENKETYQLPDSLEGKTVILHTNDVHGAIDKYAKVAALRDECYDKGAHQVILLDAGDYSQGSPYVSLSKGATALDMMALVGYDVITLGNHEFDYGFPQLMENLKKHQGDFMVACNNLVDDEGELLFAPGGTAPHRHCGHGHPRDPDQGQPRPDEGPELHRRQGSVQGHPGGRGHGPQRGECRYRHRSGPPGRG